MHAQTQAHAPSAPNAHAHAHARRRSSSSSSSKGRNRRPEILVEDAHDATSLDAAATAPVLVNEATSIEEAEIETLGSSAGQRLERLIDRAKARPQIAVGVVAAAGIVVTTLVWSKVGRLMLLAAGGYVVDRLYGKAFRTTVKRLSAKLPAKLTR